jgi:hypothetical protein
MAIHHLHLDWNEEKSKWRRSEALLAPMFNEPSPSGTAHFGLTANQIHPPTCPSYFCKISVTVLHPSELGRKKFEK